MTRTWIGLVSMLLLATAGRASTPCDFKGLSVGDRLGPAEVMAKLGISTYHTNPKPALDIKTIEKYGLLPAAEMIAEASGPGCDYGGCQIPAGITFGNERTPVKVFVGLKGDLVTEIDVFFGMTYWDELLPVLNQKYGDDWAVTRDADFLVTDYETKKNTNLTRISIEHSTPGANPRTGDRCQIWASNFDIVFEHHDSLGPYHSIFAIKLISKDF